MKLEDILLGKVNQVQKDRYNIFSSQKIVDQWLLLAKKQSGSRDGDNGEQVLKYRLTWGVSIDILQYERFSRVYSNLLS